MIRRTILANLRTGHYVEWANMGHVAAGHDTFGCVGDIASAFLDNPQREPDSHCGRTNSTS